VLARNRRSLGRWLVGADRTYVDLSAFQVVEGLRCAFPNAMAALELPFNQFGIFRRYPELDAPGRRPPHRGTRRPSAAAARP